MSRKSVSVPKYRLHKSRHLAKVTLNGRDFYLGKHGSPESKAAYDRLVGEYMLRGGQAPDASEDLSVNEVMLAYLDHADGYYRDADGQPTREVSTMTLAFRPLKKLYGTSLAMDFGPLGLKNVRRELIEGGLARSVINQRIGYVKRMFAWACSEELIPPQLYYGLLSVKNLQMGRSCARETEPVQPVPPEHVAAILPFLPRSLQTMVKLQQITGMRSGELVQMCPEYIDTTDDIWLYKPKKHKTAWRGKTRIIPLGPRCQELLTSYVDGVGDVPFFSPKQAVKERNAAKRRARKTRVQPSQKNRREKHPRKAPADQYDTSSYYQALRYAMVAANKAGALAQGDFWHPHQLRHAAAFRLQREVGLEAARAYLGHATANMTAHYAGLDVEAATSAAAIHG